MTGALRSITLPRKERCVPSRLVGKTICSRDRERGGKRAATFYSLLGSAKLNGLYPEAYLRDILEHTPLCPKLSIYGARSWERRG